MNKLSHATAARRLANASFNTTRLLAALALAWPAASHAADASPAADADAAQSVLVVAPRPAAPAPAAIGSSDLASLLLGEPGASVYGAGGVSGLPALRGLADDRIKIRVDGGEATAACGNHMNAPLSYADPTLVASTRVSAGITPVSAGGDNIAGVIEVDTVQPLFAPIGQPLLATGSLTFQGRSVDAGRTRSATATLANDWLSATYAGARTAASSYEDGNGHTVLDTLYKSINQSLTLGARTPDQLWTLKIGQQRIPYQGFANQFMDMTDNHATHANLAWDARLGWGALHAKAFWQDTRHEMGFFSDERSGTMPMNTHGRDASGALQADVAARGGTLRLGAEFHRYRLDDWWPAVAGSMMMGPQDFVNVDGGRRDRLGLFGEWDGKVSERWSVDTGVRAESVHTDAGAVQDYGCGMMCAADAAAAATFNASERRRRDTNLDATLVARLEADPSATYEFGVARKTRSPSLYERYSWGRGTMAMTMIGWFGDANGYVGAIGLRPEVADTVSATADWHDAGRTGAFLRVTPFFTAVHDFIDADVIGSYQPGAADGPTQALLQFANHDAHLYGVNVSWRVPVATSAARGQTSVQGKFDWTRGRRNDGGDLYHIMPPSLNLALVQTLGGWSAQAELQAVARKSRVDARREEPTTPAYALVNLGTRHEFAHGSSVQLGVRNLFDRQYATPLGGVDIAAFEAGGGTLAPVAAPGRSIDVAGTWRF